MGFGSSCGLFSEDSGDDEVGEADKFGGVTTLECSSSQRCRGYCDKWFTTNSSLLDKCFEQESDDITKLNATILSMEKGSWDSIKTENLHILTKFDEDLWPKYASVNNKPSLREMLIWVAENEEIADLLDEDNEVLKNAFTILGAPTHEDEAMFEGMKQDVDVDRRRTFFEVSVFNNNNEAFKAAHALLKEECNDRRTCVKKVYCDIDVDSVFGRLNELELGEDADTDGDSLHRDECN